MTLAEYQAIRERDDDEADAVLGELYENDMPLFFQCREWEIETGPQYVPDPRVPEGW